MIKQIAVFLITLMFIGTLPAGRAAAGDLTHGFIQNTIDETSGAEEYTFSPVSGAYSEITGGTLSSATGDDGFEDLSLPFVFTYDSLTFNSVRISVNGWMQLGQTYSGSGSANDLANVEIRPVLAPFWDDLYDDATSEIRYQLLGTSPEQIFVAQWKAVRWPGSGGSRQNFQLRLYENGNKIEFVYGTMSASTNTSASIGLSGASTSFGKFLSVTPGSPASASSTAVNNSITSVNFLSSGTTYQFLPPCFHLWMGMVSQDWTASGNWNCNAVPGSVDNATVTGTGSYKPEIEENTSLARLDIDAGNSLTLSGGNLAVEGIRIEGSLVVSANETITLTGSTLAWNRLPANGTFDPGIGTVSFQGSNILTIHADEIFHHVTIQSGKTFDPGEYQITIKGNFTNQGTFWPSQEVNKMQFKGPVVNQGVWRGQLSRMIFEQGFENNSSGTFTASQNTDVGTEFRGNVTNLGTFNASDGGKLSAFGDWSNSGIFSAGSGTITLKRTGKQYFEGGNSSEYFNIIVDSGSEVDLKSNLTVLHDLEIKPNARFDLGGHILKVENQLINSGAVVQTLPVPAGSSTDFLKISNKAGTRWVYWGVNLNPVSDMGQTRVVILGSPQAGCSSNTSDAMIRRCYKIEPQAPVSAVIRLYFIGSEMNGQVFSGMKLWHFGSGWAQVGSNYTHSEACTTDQLDCWFQAEAISDYSMFGLGSGGIPTSVRISRLSSGQQHNLGNFALLMIILSSLVVILGGAFKKRLKNQSP
jgi:hypothetical protein